MARLPAARPTLLGVRHHGPGSARAVGAALARLRPDIVLIEGPPEADPLLSFAAEPGLRPPVALLAHAVDDPAQAGFWPYADFSPEWVAITHASGHGVPVRFIDLPVAVSFTLDRARRERENDEPAEPVPSPVDPIAALARLAGRDDAEHWWEDVIEHRPPADDPLRPFAALAEAMAALREDERPAVDPGPTAEPDIERLREAHMRQCVRAARRAGHTRIAVVCGAWHVPALADPPSAAADRALLAPHRAAVKVETTWVPWTHHRLAQNSGYGAGVASPGWYRHLFDTAAEPDPLPRWFVRIATLLREAGHPVSSAHVIEATRHADALAALRGRPLAGLDETLEAVRAVMCDGVTGPLALVHDALVVGDVIGEVPPTVPAVPLQRDLTREQRRLRLRPEPAARELELDLRKDSHADRSRLLNRLALLDVPWGVPVPGRESRGTFRETWRLDWQPELAIRVAEAGVWGTTVVAAAEARASDLAIRAESLADVTEVAERCLRADLPDALPVIMRVLDRRAALDADVGRLADALPGLVRALRYGDVRGTDTSALDTVVAGLVVRICVGLPAACAGLDHDGAAAMRRRLDDVHAAVQLLPERRQDEWYATLRRLADRENLPGLLTGRATRLLLDLGRLAPEAAAPRLARALTRGVPHRESAAWIEGFLAGGGMLLIHDEGLLDLVDAWITGTPDDLFVEILPLLRRTFATFAAPERRLLGERIRTPARAAVPIATAEHFDGGRADAVLPLLAGILGLAHREVTP
ncbi:DUF5682 family protein [Embleya hyalina]|uniref:Uncharacterized protein n=1 Tax=Embleya hyalina TaxID=516124 RepID=A0A401YLF6_9ACTN|nr:DUF5682 family protein [Embleya hyalina]GCD95442.1 hypothetical protein EHYA_03116 [Embleya hyalina]